MPDQERESLAPGRAVTDTPTLREGSTGAAVVELQTLLARAGFSPGRIDGVFGQQTEDAVRGFQRARGLGVDGIVGPTTWAALRAPAPAPTPVSGLRQKIVAEATWGVTNAAGIHYQQLRPMDGLQQRHKLPLNTDCSGFVTLCYKWAGAGDPNGMGFNGEGYTGTLLSFLTRISQSQLKAGDLVLWAQQGVGKHVALVIETGSDPLLVSHGAEEGPYTVRFSASNRYHAGKDVYWLRLPSVDAAGREAAPGMLQQLRPELREYGKSDSPSEKGLAREATSIPVQH